MAEEIPLFKVFTNLPYAADAVEDVLHSGYTGQGKQVELFETALANLWSIDREQVVTVNSCTSALQLALRLSNVKPGDTVLTSPMTCAPTAWVILAANAKIVWVDIDPLTGCISPEDAARKLQMHPKARALIAMDWGGLPCDLEQLISLTEQFKCKLIVDAAHSAKSTYYGSHAVKYADYVCHSFQSIKTLSTGDGGALVCKSLEDANRAKLLRWFGIDRDRPIEDGDMRAGEDIAEWGYKFHMGNVPAAIGLANIKHTDRLVRLHQANAEFYHSALVGIKKLNVPPRYFDRTSSYWLYTLLVNPDDRDSLMDYLKRNGVASSKVHARLDKHSCVKEFQAKLPGVDEFYSREICIPVGWWLTVAQRENIAYLIQHFMA